MAKAKMIKEVEVKFSPAFDKAINGVKTTKKVTAKTKTAKPKTKKATAKPKAVKVTQPKAVKVTKAKVKTKAAGPKAAAKPRGPRGYTITPIQRALTLNGVSNVYDLFELAGPKMDAPKYFITEDHAQRYIQTNEGENAVVNALSGKGYQHIKGVVSAHKELLDAALLPEFETDLPDKCDKHSIEDTDA